MTSTSRGAPAVIVSVDTEADDQWSYEGRQRMEVVNAERLPALQTLCERHGARPTYLCTWEMVTRPQSAQVLCELAASGRCEIGSHLHPWSSPPFRPEDVRDLTYPHNLPPDLFDRQITELTGAIRANIGVQPTSYRAGRSGMDGRALPVLERLGYTVDTSVIPLLNETRKRGPNFAGAPIVPYHPDYADVRRAGSAHILEVPVTAGTFPRLPKLLERSYVSLPAVPHRGALKRVGLRPVWLRPSYSSLGDMRRFASKLARAGVLCFNVTFHSSELLAGGSPYNPDARAVERFLHDLSGLLEHLTERLGCVGRTLSELAAMWDSLNP